MAKRGTEQELLDSGDMLWLSSVERGTTISSYNISTLDKVPSMLVGLQPFYQYDVGRKSSKSTSVMTESLGNSWKFQLLFCSYRATCKVRAVTSASWIMELHRRGV